MYIVRCAQSRIDQAALENEIAEGIESGQVPFLLAERARSEGWEGHPRWSCAPGTRALRRSMRGQTRWSPVLVQRAVSEDPRWTRAVGDHSSPPSRKTMKECGLDVRSKGHGHSLNEN
jgi:hypothetical protein